MNRAAIIAIKALSLIHPDEVILIFYGIACYDIGLYARGATW